MSGQPWWKGKRGEWYVAAQMGLMGVTAVAPLLFPSPNKWPIPWSWVGWIAGAILAGVGFWLALAGLWALGQNLSALPHPKEGAVLVEKGAYRLVRHPIYSGIVLGSLGWGLFMHNWPTMVAAGLMLLFFDVKSRREERWLSRKFPDYPAYQRRVKKLIPFLY